METTGNSDFSLNNLGPEEFASGPIYALELAMNNHARYVKTRADVLIVWFHWCLLRNGFYFFGGELTHNDFHSETLPPNLGFNGDRRAYVLKYGKGVMPFAVGFYLKGEGIDISFCSLYRSLRLNIGIEDLVDECLNLQDDVVQQLTMLVDEELIKPMQLDGNARDGGADDVQEPEPEPAQEIEDTPQPPEPEPAPEEDLDDQPPGAETFVAQNVAPYSRVLSNKPNKTRSNSPAAKPSQTLMAMSSPIQTRAKVPQRRFTPCPQRIEDRYRIRRATAPNNSNGNAETSEPEEEDDGRPFRKRKGPTGCCG